MRKIYLASSSPRRVSILNDLLSLNNIHWEIKKPTFDEIENGHSPKEIAIINAKGKVISVKDKVEEDALVIGADTVISLGDHILGKPTDEQAAIEYLKLLSGKEHSVITGIVILDKLSNKLYEEFDETLVQFKCISEEEIIKYAYSGEPLDKAGAYGIQGSGKEFILNIKGSYQNVVGLPEEILRKMLLKTGLNLKL